jgi:hypothetical protein
VARLIREVERAATAVPDHVAQAIDAIKAAIGTEADTYVLGGVLVEGLAVVLSHVPPSRRAAVGAAVTQMLGDRLRHHGVL